MPIRCVSYQLHPHIQVFMTCKNNMSAPNTLLLRITINNGYVNGLAINILLFYSEPSKRFLPLALFTNSPTYSPQAFFLFLSTLSNFHPHTHTPSDAPGTTRGSVSCPLTHWHTRSIPSNTEKPGNQPTDFSIGRNPALIAEAHPCQ